MQKDETVNRMGNESVEVTSAGGQQIKKSMEKVEMAWL